MTIDQSAQAPPSGVRRSASVDPSDVDRTLAALDSRKRFDVSSKAIFLRLFEAGGTLVSSSSGDTERLIVGVVRRNFPREFAQYCATLGMERLEAEDHP